MITAKLESLNPMVDSREEEQVRTMADKHQTQLGKWIAAPESAKQLPIFRKSFEIKQPLHRAKLEIVGLGSYVVTLNGKRPTDNFSDPAWTDYSQLILHQTFNVKRLLKQGPNAIGVMLGNGIYNVIGGRYTKFKGSFGTPKLTARLTLTYTDGSEQIIESDESWKVSEGPITFSCFYGGEDYDARLLQKRWDRGEFDDSQWQQARPTEGPGGAVLPTNIRPVKPLKPLQTKAIHEVKPATWVYDLGQNAAAIPSIVVKGPKGSTIRLTPAELTTDEGLVDQCSTGGPMYYEYTLNGQGEEAWQPFFTYFGFRYVQVDGAVLEGQPNPNNLPMIIKLESIPVTYSGLNPHGQFQCSNPLLNQINNLIEWAIDSNTQSVFTDCPHREKLGWLEQVHLMGPSLLYARGNTELMAKACRDMRLAQLPNGLVPDIAPEYVVFEEGFRDSPEWGAASVLVPWQVYRHTGNKQALEDNFDMMERYVAYLGSRATNHIVDHGLGDWCDVGPKPPAHAQLTPIALTATAFYYASIVALNNASRVLRKTTEQKRYEHLATQVKCAFNYRFFDANTNTYATGSQCSNGIALTMDFVPEEKRQYVLNNLVKDILANGYRITAGDVGYRYVIRALADGGRSDIVFKMATMRGDSGYAYQLEQGATSLIESWNALRATSQNHFMLGHVLEWFYSDLAGIQQAPDSVAYRNVVIAPKIVGDVTQVHAQVTVGKRIISVDWHRQGERFELDVQVGSKARLVIPTTDPASVTISPSSLTNRAPQTDGQVVIDVEPGHYVIRSRVQVPD